MKCFNLLNLFSGVRLPISNIGYPFISLFAIVAIVCVLFDFFVLSVFFMLLTIFVCFFFRDPNRLTSQSSRILVAPADGKIIFVGVVDKNPFSNKVSRKISIFMSIFNVHVNRIPVDGKIKCIDYKFGKFLSANLDKASKDNECNAILLETVEGVEICFVQVAGLIARRIVSFVKIGDFVNRGKRFGIICFGSRVDIYVPLNVSICVNHGDIVRAGLSVIGEL